MAESSKEQVSVTDSGNFEEVLASNSEVESEALIGNRKIYQRERNGGKQWKKS